MRNFPYWYVNGLFNQEKIKEIDLFASRNYSPELKDHPAEHITKTADVKIVDWSKIKHLLQPAEEMTKYVNATEIGYDLYDFTDFQAINYNVYNSSNTGQYDWHIDATPDQSPTDIKLTVIINVSTEPFEGGDFKIFRQGVVPVPEINYPGSMIIFPSFFNHKVEPVISGTRKTVSFWIYGPKFR